MEVKSEIRTDLAAIIVICAVGFVHPSIHLPSVSHTRRSFHSDTKRCRRPAPSRNPREAAPGSLGSVGWKEGGVVVVGVHFKPTLPIMSFQPALSDSLPLHSATPVRLEVAGRRVFRSMGIAIASLLSWSLAQRTRTHTHWDIVQHSRFVRLAHKDVWLCGPSARQTRPTFHWRVSRRCAGRLFIRSLCAASAVCLARLRRALILTAGPVVLVCAYVADSLHGGGFQS